MTVRRGTPDDISAVHRLIKELADYEKAGDKVTLSEEQLRKDGFGPEPLYSFFVAELEGQIVGMALYYQKYSTWQGRSLFLEDIIVTQNQRNQGIGIKLFDEVVNVAKSLSANRLEWQVLNWNEPAIQFYNKLGALLDGEWINCKLSQEQIMTYE